MVEPNAAPTLNSDPQNQSGDLADARDAPVTDEEDSTASDDYPLSELKNLILSLDWEITDEVLEKMLQQIKDLNLTYEHDKIVLTFLQILNSLVRYIKKMRAKAHPKTFKILNSAFSSLDKVVLGQDMEETEKKKILVAEINQYQNLRIQIAQDKAKKKKNKKKRQEPSGESLAKAVEEIKQYIHAEIKALKAELKAQP